MRAFAVPEYDRTVTIEWHVKEALDTIVNITWLITSSPDRSVVQASLPYWNLQDLSAATASAQMVLLLSHGFWPLSVVGFYLP